MKPENAIEVRDVWKRFRTGAIRGRTLVQEFQSYGAQLRGKEDQNQVLDRSKLHESNINRNEWFWAVKGATFEVKKGETVVILGRNGAGKSTLLQLLCQVTEADRGEISFRGRFATLLQAGVGFNPELTGRENVFLNGSILGLTRDEIIERVPEIAEFSEIPEFLDTPVKRYSSGMKSRLGFSVAAHLGAEIMILDEVFATGDRVYRNKCIERIKELSATGTTILLVTHMVEMLGDAIDRAIYIDDGEIHFEGDKEVAMRLYLEEADTVEEAKAMVAEQRSKQVKPKKVPSPKKEAASREIEKEADKPSLPQKKVQNQSDTGASAQPADPKLPLSPERNIHETTNLLREDPGFRQQLLDHLRSEGFSKRSLDLIELEFQRMHSRKFPPTDSDPSELPKRLHFGCENRKLAGWLNVDFKNSELNVDLGSGHLPFEDDAFEVIASQHFIGKLEMKEEFFPLLAEFRRVMKPGGILWLSCPDLEKICNSYVDNRMEDLVRDHEERSLKLWDRIWALDDYAGTKNVPSSFMFSSLVYQWGKHQAMYDFDLLEYALESHGFIDITRGDESRFLDELPDFPPRFDDAQSLYVRAVNPH